MTVALCCFITNPCPNIPSCITDQIADRMQKLLGIMKLSQLTNHTLLKPFVKGIRTIHSEDLTGSGKSFRFFADGSPGIMFYQSEQDRRLNLNEKNLANLFLYGQTVKPIEIKAQGSVRIIILFLYPHVIKSLFGVEAHALTNTCIDFDLLPFAGVKSLSEQLTEGMATENQIRLLTEFLSKRILQCDTLPEKDLQYVTHALSSTNGNVPLKILQDELRVSERTFERKFLQHVGVTPRLFARICKFNTALRQLRMNHHHKLTDIAYDTGFADQSHFNRTFKEFTGLTPSEYMIYYRVVSEDYR